MFHRGDFVIDTLILFEREDTFSINRITIKALAEDRISLNKRPLRINRGFDSLKKKEYFYCIQRMS